MGETPCSGVLGLLLGHKYMPRHTVRTELADEAAAQILRDPYCVWVFGTKLPYNTVRTYYGDVCERCGDVLRVTKD